MEARIPSADRGDPEIYPRSGSHNLHASAKAPGALFGEATFVAEVGTSSSKRGLAKNKIYVWSRLTCGVNDHVAFSFNNDAMMLLTAL